MSSRNTLVDPLYVFAFIDTLIGILEEYLGEVSSSLLKEHFDIVYQVLL
jgi:AP-3 complex subunit mu